jgi:hypothetical protein
MISRTFFTLFYLSQQISIYLVAHALSSHFFFMMPQKVFIVCSFLLVFCTLCYGSADVHTDKTYIKDEAGRVRIYHGANFVNKGFPWYPTELLDPVFVANLSSWGLNFVRLGYVRLISNIFLLSHFK